MNQAAEMANAAGILFTVLAGTMILVPAIFKARKLYFPNPRIVQARKLERRRVRHWL